MPRTSVICRSCRHAWIWVLATGFAALANIAPAQVLSPPEIRDVAMRELQQKHMTELKNVARAISSHQFPYRLYFSRTLDLSEQQQQRGDQRSIRFDKYRTQTVLEITANYYAAYSAEQMQKEARARRTLQDVMVPILEAAVPEFGDEEKLQAFALEISHHVRKKVLGVMTENAENVAFVLPRESAKQFIAAQTPAEREAALLGGTLFVDGRPLEGWPSHNTEMVAAESPKPSSPRGDIKPTVGSAVLPSTSPGITSPLWPPTLPSAGASANAVPPARLAAEPRPEITPDVLRKLQSSNQEALDRLAHDLDRDAHLVSYAPPAFIAFHQGAYLQLSMTTTLRESESGSQYRVAALAFDEHVAHLIRPTLASLKIRPDFDGIDFSTSVWLAGTATGSVEAVEFIFPTAALACYERYDCTGQQLINQGYVLINGERVNLDLQSAEAGNGQR